MRHIAIHHENGATGEAPKAKETRLVKNHRADNNVCPCNRVFDSLRTFLYRETEAREGARSGEPFVSAGRPRISETL
jgi:hypothetical protein